MAATTRVVTLATDTPVPGQTTLREAIAVAEDGDAIEFAANLFSGPSATTIKLSSALRVAKNLTLVGPGDSPTTRAPKLQLEGSGMDRILQIISPASVVVAGISFHKGVAGGGGAVLVEAGATATFQACDFANNEATGTTSGGAILNRGVLTIDQCLVTLNRASNGGGVASVGMLQVARSLLEGNIAQGFGGGIHSTGANLLVESSTISGNSGGTSGGIAFFSGDSTARTATLTAVSVIGNRSDRQTGGLYVEGSGSVAIVGGSVFARNVVLSGGGGEALHDFGTQKSGKITSADYNILVKPGTTLSPYGLNDQVGVDPQLGPLAYNGGRTRTYAIGLASPARDRGAPGFLGSLALTDQRGEPRVWPSPPGGRVDVGAFEFAAQLSFGPPLVFEATAAATPATLTASLILPRGGTATVRWTIGSVPESPYALTIPDTVQVQQITSTGSFRVGTTPVTLAVSSGALSLTSSTTVTVTDTMPPELTLPADQTIEATGAAGAVASFSASAIDLVSGVVPVTFSMPSGSMFPLGVTFVTVTARDAANNTASRVFKITVRDTTPPVIAAQPNLTVEATSAAGAVVNFAPTAADSVSAATVTTSPASGSTFPLGTTTVTITAKDAANNTATRTFTVMVRDTTPPVIAPHPNLNVLASVAGGAVVTFSPTATDAVSLPTVTISPASGTTFGVGTTTVTITAKDVAGNTATGSFTVTVSDPFGVTLNNVAWPLAADFNPKLVGPAGGNITGSIQQIIARAGESRWFRFTGKPGSKVAITLTNLPGNFDVVVYSDIRRAHNQLLGLTGTESSDADKKLALLGAEFAPEAYSPEAYSPEAYSPEAYSPEAYSPEAYSPEAYSPEAYSPEAYAPEAYSPEAYSPEAYSPEAYSPEAYSPEAYSPEAYASAQQRSIVAFSASPGTSSEGIRFNTYTKSGDFYVRVRGQNGVFALNAPFTLTVSVQQNLCAGVTDFNTTPARGAPVIAGSPTSLIVWDSTRIAGTPAELSALESAIARFATAANGVVLNVSSDPQIARLNLQADANPDCPSAKNLVADAIRNLIQLYRKAAPTIADITLVGNDSGIPFFRSDDKALLASEANYFPPVKDGTQSQSSLRFAQVLSQDRYGSSSQIVLGTGPYDLPEVPVGRLVETAAEIAAYLDAYAPLFNGSATSGSVPTPRSAFVAGYDFLADSAEAMKTDLIAGLGFGATVASLISASNQAPSLGWTADQLRTVLLGSRHDISYLAGHFSTGRALAADFTTRFTAKEIADSTVNLAYALMISAGCHSGYSTVDNDAIALLTEQPDWAQAFARKKAMLIGGTGYQYGDTDFIEYTERLLLEFARAMRTGTGPVSVGRALVVAKRRYLADTAIVRGIHEKTLLQVTLYGLPMVKFNLPGARLTRPVPVADVTSVLPVASGPGAALNLKRGELSFTPVLTRVDKTLKNVSAAASIVSSYFVGSDGLVTIPGEPVRPLESFNVSRPDGFVRGVGFRAGQYHELTGFVPFTGAPATESRGVHGRFSTEVFYPIRPWNVNQTGELSATNGISTFNAFPTQFVSDGPNSTTGILRAFDRMQFTIFYCPSTSAAALANPPALNVVASSVGANAVAISVDAAATAGAGVQEVWVTYTGLPGTPFYGAWQSLTLTAPANAAGIGTWTGTLPLPAGTDASLIRFMVQAVNGVGAVAQNTNFGRFFKPGSSTLDGVGVVGAPTTLSFVGTVPTSGYYRALLPLQVRLTDASGVALAGKRIQFRLGSVTKSATTNASGTVDAIASTALVLAANPGAYTLEASFAGDAGWQNSAATRPFTVTKMPTRLTFEAGLGLVGPAGQIIKLRAEDGTPVKERTIVFVLVNGATRTALSEITDFAGQARLSSATIAPGTYQVTAYFGLPVTLPDGTTAQLSDPLYGGSTASNTITIGAALSFSGEQARVSYADANAPGATADNLGVSRVEIEGLVTLSGKSLDPNSLLASPRAETMTASVRATLAGKTIATGSVVLRVYSNDKKHWRGQAVLGGSAVQLFVDWDNELNGGAKYHVWVSPPSGSGPLYNVVPTLLRFELTLGTGAGEHPAGGLSEIGGAAKPWTQQTGNQRLR